MISGGTLIPIGIQRHLYLPNGRRECGEINGLFLQLHRPKPPFNITHWEHSLDRSGSIWLETENAYTLFKSLESIHTLGLPLDFCTSTILLIKSILLSAGAMIPLLWKYYSSYFKGFIMATWNLLFWNCTGFTDLLILILYSPSRQQSALNTSAYSVFICCSDHWLIVGFSIVTMLSIGKMFS